MIGLDNSKMTTFLSLLQVLFLAPGIILEKRDAAKAAGVASVFSQIQLKDFELDC